tara:strand:+ start:44 stop:460 length:417 start_codon:yes stop_codon:yes gene_type:complete
MGYITPLLKLSFWFKINPGPLMPMFYWVFLIFFGLLFVASIVCGRIYKKEKDQFVLRFSAKYLKNWLLTASIVGFLLLLFNYERVALLSARFWYGLWTIGFGVWLGFIIKKIRQLPDKKKGLIERAKLNKYLPKKKKK